MRREDILTALGLVSPAIAKKETTPQSRCFVFAGSRVVTCNGDLVMRTPINLDGVELRGAIEAAPLMGFLERIPDNDIKMRINGGALEIKAAGKKCRVPIDLQVLAPLDQVSKPTEWQKIPDAFWDHMKQASGTVSSDDDQFAVTCVELTPNTITATDGWQLVRGDCTTGVAERTLVLGSSIKPICGYGCTEVSDTQNWLHFRNPVTKTIASVRKHDASDFPNADKPLKRRGQPVIIPSGISTAIDVSRIFSDDEFIHVSIDVNDDKGWITISGQGQAGEFKESHPILYRGTPIKFLIKAAVLKLLSDKNANCELDTGFIRCDSGALTLMTSTQTIASQEDGGD